AGAGAAAPAACAWAAGRRVFHNGAPARHTALRGVADGGPRARPAPRRAAAVGPPQRAGARAAPCADSRRYPLGLRTLSATARDGVVGGAPRRTTENPPWPTTGPTSYRSVSEPGTMKSARSLPSSASSVGGAVILAIAVPVEAEPALARCARPSRRDDAAF